jgi:hypothetical protein
MGRLKRGREEKGRYLLAAPKESQPDSLQYITFCLRHIVASDDFSFEDRSDEEKLALINTLRTLSQLTWAQIRGSHRHGLGTEKIDHGQLKFTLPSHVTHDVTILAIRFMGKAPMLGYRDGATFHIICLDPNFCAYNHGS